MGQVALINLPQEVKEFFVSGVANHYTVPDMIKVLKDTFPDIYDYSATSYRKYLQSDEGKALLEKKTDEIREEAKTHSFAHSGSRIAVLTELAEKVLRRLRLFPDTEIGGKEFILVAGELRQTFKDLRDETDRLGLTGEESINFFNSLMKLVQGKDNKLPSFLDDIIYSEPLTADNVNRPN